MTQARVRHFLLLTGGWAALGTGLVLLPMPVPMPVPVAVPLMLTGAAILTVRSRRFRHGVRYARHRHRWLSRSIDTVGTAAPARLQRVLHRTRPDLIERHARRRAARDLSAV